MQTNVESLPAGTTVSWQDSIFKILMTPAETGGQLGMFSVTSEPGFGPPRHIHHGEDEIIHIVDGEVRFWLEGEMLIRSSGDTVFIPRGKEHAFRILGDKPARFVTCVTPGGFESFFATAANRGLQVPEHMVEIKALGKRFGCEFTGPPIQ